MQTRTWSPGLVKAAVFGFLIALMGCYQGYNSRGGAAGRRRGDDGGGGQSPRS